jgi:hypothetical protein
MEKKISPLWDFIAEKHLKNLNVESFNFFLQRRGENFFKDITDFSSQDLITFLFIECESVLDEMDIDASMEPKDQLFDCLMQLCDYYTPIRYLLAKIQADILEVPSFYPHFICFLQRITKKIGIRCNIKKIEIMIGKNLFLNELLKCGMLFPNEGKDILLSLFLIYFLKQWMNDESDNFEKTMVNFETVMQYCKIL